MNTPADRTATDAVPTVFFHRGNQRHLAHALAAARRSDPTREIVLLGDCANRTLARSLGVRHLEADAFSAGARRLDAIYVHRSTLGRNFELPCLQRWFSILEWMEADRRERAVHLDSDVLLYAPLAPMLAALARWPMTMVIDAGHVAAINQRAALAAFCRLVESHYNSPEGLRRLEERHREHLFHSEVGGISDMTFLKLFLRERPDLMASTPGPLGEAGWRLDLTMNDGVGGFEMDGPFKRIKWKNGVPHGFITAEHRWVPFLTLHFQGPAKRLVPGYTPPLPFFTRSRLVFNDLAITVARVDRVTRRLLYRSSR